MLQFVKWRDPFFWFDLIYAVLAMLVGIVSALSAFGLLDIFGPSSDPNWLFENRIPLIILSAICLLIISTFLERRVKLESLQSETRQGIANILSQQEELSQLMKGFPATGIKFEDRIGHTVPFGARIVNAQHVDILGLSLGGILTHYGNFFLKKTREGCKFRVLLVDPDSHAVSSAAGFLQENVEHRQEEIRGLARNLEALIDAGNFELKFTSIAPPYSLLIIDPEESNGQVQAELYAYNVYASERPHFVLTQAIDKHWYDFFRMQFEQLWNDARPQNTPLTEAGVSGTNEV